MNANLKKLPVPKIKQIVVSADTVSKSRNTSRTPRKYSVNSLERAHLLTDRSALFVCCFDCGSGELNDKAILMFAGGGAGFQKQSKPPWDNANSNTEVTSSW
ncbi:unnamed protein product [Parnassius apollo]|uniref:(apollo) hypothetical protein n=1 Tax=Parnassius apollo TaxID=110799 RepID=A0A8S3WXY8_PARAO|nr:unnamed protein product [Parnassius apollo]